MDTKVMGAEAARRELSELIDEVVAGTNVVLGRDGKPLVAVIRYDDYVAVQEQLEDLHDLRLAEAAYAEYLRDPSTARPWEEVVAEWHAKDAETKDNETEEE
jgi:prevent-host-death family protein